LVNIVMGACPKCDFPLSDGAVECPACGVVIAKYLAQAARAPRPAAAVPPPLPPASENLQQAPGLPGIGGPLLFFVLLQAAEMVYVVVDAKKALLPLILEGTKIEGLFPFLPVAVNFVGIFKAVQIAGGLFGIVLILSRAPRTPSYWRGLLMFTFIADGVGFWVLNLIPEYREPSVNTAVLPALRSVLGEVQEGNLVDMAYALLCFVYWSISPYVKSTFVVPSNPSSPLEPSSQWRSQ
jgi:hypothetical protein